MRLAPLLLASFFAACTSASSSPTQPTTDTGVVADAPPFTPDPCKSSLTEAAAVTVGSGQTVYVDLTDDQAVTWEKGPQGGHHVWVALRDIGIREQGTITVVEADDVEDPSNPIVINKSQVIYDFTPEEGGHCVLTGVRMQLDNAGAPPLTQTNGHHVKLTATLTDLDGATATSSKTIVVSGDPN